MFLSREHKRVNFKKFSQLLETVKFGVTIFQQRGLNHFEARFLSEGSNVNLSQGASEKFKIPKAAWCLAQSIFGDIYSFDIFRKVNSCVFLHSPPPLFEAMQIVSLLGGSVGRRAVLSFEHP